MKVVGETGALLEPRDFVDSMRRGAIRSGAYWVSGPSSEVGAAAHQLLDQRTRVAYFLIAGSQESRVPCFRAADRGISRAPRPADALDLINTLPSGQQVFDEFERAELRGASGVASIVVESITPASDEELAFVRLALTSRLAQYRPVIVLTHNRCSEAFDVDEASLHTLSALFLTGGRIRATDWDAAGLDSGQRGVVDRRVVNGETWYTYAGRQIVSDAPGRHSSKALKQLLQVIAGQPWYPVLRIASRSDTLDELLEAYSPQALAAALTDDPRGAARYFRRLERVARAAGKTDMARIAAANYLAITSSARPVRAYRVAASGGAPGLEPDHAARLWFAIGQSLARESEAEAQSLAVDAFHRSAAAASLPSQQHSRMMSRVAAAANGEALVAYKRRQIPRARSLEESALRAVASAGESHELRAQAILLRSHLGDIYLRGLNDPGSALDAYRVAFEQALASPADDELRYVVPRLAAALLGLGQPAEAADALMQLIARTRRRTRSLALSSDGVLLKAHLTLAEAYLRSGDQRGAAACYWSLVRSRRLAPAAARGVAANLRQCHPRLSARAEGALERTLAQHEASAEVAGRVLAALHPIPSRILEPEVE
jgi:hypothetical protein